MQEKVYNPSNLSEYLNGYYGFLFPHNLFHQWLSYGNVKKGYFENREFSFTLPGDIYIRFNSYETLPEMRKAITSRLPIKIDIGAVYNSKPKDSKKVRIGEFIPEERELVFDIDMTDYDEVRTCCQGTDICPKCWTFMVVAAKILEGFLREDFGFKHLLWVYSGRRGIHCWVADESARKLKNQEREAIVSFINIYDGGHFKAKKVELDGNRGVHPSIVRSIGIIHEYFDKLMVQQQDFLEKPEQIEQTVNLVVDEALRKELKTYLNDSGLRDTTSRWKAFQKISTQFYRQNQSTNKNFTVHKHRHLVEEVLLQLCFPRLDVNVSKGLNHLLKVPFSVHPKTGRICVPIDFKQIDTFDPFTVPTVAELCEQIDSLQPKANGGGEEGGDGIILGSSRLAEQTSLAQPLNVFRNFIRGMQTDHQRGILVEKNDHDLAF